MEVVTDLERFEPPAFSVVTIGTYDGVHLGHLTILKKMVDEAKKRNGKSILITFWPHPRFILRPDDHSLKLLSTFDEKANRISNIGVDYIMKLQFTSSFSEMSADQFVKDILVDGVGAKKVFLGYDHHFGKNREGNIIFLESNKEKYGFEVEEISRQAIDDMAVSSTKIRNALLHSDVSLAAALLGRPYAISGKVAHGHKKGRSIGFPTANIEIAESFKLLPADGVYAVKVIRESEEWKGMVNIGYSPTLEGKERRVEVHLFNFTENLYHQTLTIVFFAYIRNEKKFNSLAMLQAQLELDKKTALNLLK